MCAEDLDRAARFAAQGAQAPLVQQPQSPIDGPITVPNHPFNAPAAGFPDLRGKVINAVATPDPTYVAVDNTGGVTASYGHFDPTPVGDGLNLPSNYETARKKLKSLWQARR